MLKKPHKITQNIAKRLQMAPEAMGCLRVTLLDNTHAFIENHRGVLEYTTRRVCVRTPRMNVTVGGQSLMLERFGRDDVVIRGDIHEVKYEISGEGGGHPLRMWNFFTGYVMIRVEGLSLERFLNMAGEAGVHVYDVKRASYTVLHAMVSPRGLKKLQSVVPEKYAVTVRKSAGLTVGMRRIARRRALMIGMALVLLAAVAASFFVWEVRVTGIDAREAIALKGELETFGIYSGAFKGNIDLQRTETKLIISHDEFAWIDIKFSGVVALVTVVPAELPPEMVDDSRPCNIVAKRMR